MKQHTRKKNQLNQTWYDAGYAHGITFVHQEATYEDLAAIAREKAIPAHWDIFRAEVLNRFLTDPTFDFPAYSKGFGQACEQIFNSLTQKENIMD
ncbi:MAG: hypothetical protein K9L23_14990 [Desulfotignum sp.]|nr:hypothetical protein [Desulfotignum sp.]